MSKKLLSLATFVFDSPWSKPVILPLVFLLALALQMISNFPG